MSEQGTPEASEAEIAVHWQEEANVNPPEKFVVQANLTDNKVLERFSLDNFPDCFKEYADLLDWYRTWDVTLDTSNPPFWRWFVGGRINASYNCVDRHLAEHKNKTAIHFVPEPEQEAIQHVTYQELFVRVNEVAALLRDFCGLKKGDRVTLHMPMVPELPITMLACARLGVIHSQPWRIAEELAVNIFHTSPTAIRALRRAGPDEPRKYNHGFKHMTTVGEPIEPAVWRWYYDVVGKGEAVIVDTWWQTENGGFLCSTVPALHPMKPGSAGPGVPGIHPIIYDEVGNEIPPRSGRAGNICIQNPWPGSFQTIWKDPDRFVQQYYARYCKNRTSRDWRDWPYMAGDGALQAADGYYRILGRIDDVINVAGHRLGTKEIESASLLVEEIAEAAVVPARDEIKGRVPDLYVSLKPGLASSEDIRKRVEDSVIREIGPIARPRRVVIVPDMPKTRSGKIMRRVLGAISNNEDAGDISTLANPEIVDEIRKIKA